MLKNLLILPDGTELFSGPGTGNAIKSVSMTKCVNSGEDLTIGSTCATLLEVDLITLGGGVSLLPGDEVTLYKVDSGGNRRQEGIYILEQPVRQSANAMRLTGYDRVVKLDKDLTEWVKSLAGWPYNAVTFAAMVCQACGVEFTAEEVPNGDYLIQKFERNGVTGRQIMKWLGELCCRFCRANAAGKIEMSWYAPLKSLGIGYKAGLFNGDVQHDSAADALSITMPSLQTQYSQGAVSLDSPRLEIKDDGNGNVVFAISESIDTLTYFQKGLAFDQYETAPIDAVQISFAENSESYRWPEQPTDANCYVISGNPFLGSTTETVGSALQTICDQLQGVSYTPCRVEVPANLDIDAGHIVTIMDKNGVIINAYVMTKTTKGQKDTLECTGSHRRDSTTAKNNLSTSEVAQQKVDAQTQEDIFRKLTNGGEAKGVFLKDGQLYINASYLAAGIISSEDGKLQIDLSGKDIPVFNTGISTNGIIVRGDETKAPVLMKMGIVDLEGKKYASLDFYDVDGNKLAYIAEDVSQGGAGIVTQNDDGSLEAVMQAGAKSAMFRLMHNGERKAYLGLNPEGMTTLKVENALCQKINPGKTLLFNGTASRGSTCDVPNTSDYDLFAVRLGDDSGAVATTILAYKASNKIQGIGGWCGTETAKKQLFFLSATFSGNTWTIVDAGVHDVLMSGGISEGLRLKVKQIRGVI